MTIQTTIEKNIKEVDVYAWANNPIQMNKFEEVTAPLHSATHDDRFAAFFLTNEIADTKKESSQDFEPHLRKFVALDQLAQAAKARFNKMHQATLGTK